MSLKLYFLGNFSSAILITDTAFYHTRAAG